MSDMSVSAPASTSTSSARRAGDARPVPPPAVRLVRPGWRDPRLVVGLLLVCGSVVLGGTLLAGDDDTTPVWTTRGPVAAGDRLEPDDLRVAQVRFAAQADAERYLSAGEPLGDGLVAARDLGSGELLPADAVVAADADVALREVPLTLPAGSVPPAARPGARVDVWVTAAAGTGAAGRRTTSGAPAAGRLLLEDVAVLSADRAAVGGPEALRQVVVGVPGDVELGAVLDAVAQGAVVLVGRP